MPLERLDTPIRCAESNRTIRFAVSLLVLEAEAKTFPILPFLNPHPLTPSSTVRTSLEQVNRPFRRAESNGGVHLAVGPLVLEEEAKTLPVEILKISKIVEIEVKNLNISMSP